MSQDEKNAVEELVPSELGTKQYWEDCYDKELRNFEENGDKGEVWFGEDSMYRVMRWLSKNTPDLVQFDSSILDIGCGNGMMSIELFNEGYTNVIGIDYSDNAVQFAKRICETHDIRGLNFEVCDIVQPIQEDNRLLKPSSFDVCIDKGTFDAISLCPEQKPKNMKQKYIQNVHSLLKDSRGLFIITSCNWTEWELKNQFCDYFEDVHVIPTPEFKFGGKLGKMTTSMIFKKICKSN